MPRSGMPPLPTTSAASTSHNEDLPSLKASLPSASYELDDPAPAPAFAPQPPPADAQHENNHGPLAVHPQPNQISPNKGGIFASDTPPALKKLQ